MAMTIDEALALAVEAHAGQWERTGTPYVFHLVRVAQRLRSKDDQDRIVALLHDIVEDTKITLRDLKNEGLTSEQVDCVDRLTRRHGEPYQFMLERVIQSQPASLVKLADIEDHLDVLRDLGHYQWEERDALRVKRYADAWKLLAQRHGIGG